MRRDSAWDCAACGKRGMRKATKRDASCLFHSHGEIREFSLRTPCTSLDRQSGRLEKLHGNGDITPLAALLIQMGEAVLDALAEVAVHLPRA
ncbi:hypothetical protein [Amycolatopsis methanolica]|nr:hypothetical protein [Amycolatopsis methanolica]